MTEQATTPRRRRIGLLAAGGTAVGALATGALMAGPAAAATAPSSTTTNTCGNGTTVSMQLQHSDPGRIEAGFQIDRATINSLWRVHLTHDGATYFLRQRTAPAPDGSFSVDRVLPNLSGIDTVSGTARNLATGQVCRVSGRI